LFRYFLSYKDDIEHKLGIKLEWVEANKASRIKARIKVANILDASNDEGSFSWLVSNIELFKKTFLPKFQSYLKENK
jgi:hypothetical protein